MFSFQSHNFRIKQSMLWHNSREQKGNNVLQLFASGELWQERVGVEWNEKMGRRRDSEKLFPGIHLSSNREIETQTVVETAKSNNSHINLIK